MLASEPSDEALYLIENVGRHYVTADEHRVAVWTAFAEDLQTAREAEMTAWRARHPWSARGQQSVEDLVDAAGTAALYQSDFVLTGSTLPRVLYAASDHGHATTVTDPTERAAVIAAIVDDLNQPHDPGTIRPTRLEDWAASRLMRIDFD